MIADGRAFRGGNFTMTPFALLAAVGRAGEIVCFAGTAERRALIFGMRQARQSEDGAGAPGDLCLVQVGTNVVLWLDTGAVA